MGKLNLLVYFFNSNVEKFTVFRYIPSYLICRYVMGVLP